jgi:hypothetical protein
MAGFDLNTEDQQVKGTDLWPIRIGDFQGVARGANWPCCLKTPQKYFGFLRIPKPP